MQPCGLRRCLAYTSKLTHSHNFLQRLAHIQRNLLTGVRMIDRFMLRWFYRANYQSQILPIIEPEIKQLFCKQIIPFERIESNIYLTD